MRILYNLPHLHDWLDDPRAGHLIRANELLSGLEANGCEIVHVKPRRDPHRPAITDSCSDQTPVSPDTSRQEAPADQHTRWSMRAIVHRYLPRTLALVVRDAARYIHHLAGYRTLLARVRSVRPDALIETYEVSSFASALVARRTGVPLVIDDLCPLDEHWELYGTGSKWLSRRVRQLVLNQASVLVAVNGANAGALRRDGVPDVKIVQIPNGVRLDALSDPTQGPSNALRRQRRAALGIDTEVLGLYIGSFQPFHRVDVLIDAMADPALRDVELVVAMVGDGDGIDTIRRHARTLGVDDRLRWVGRVPHDEVAEYVAAADIGIVAGATDNVNPMKVYEYLAGGLAVVAPALPTIAELLDDGRAGAMFERDDPQSMARCLAALVNDPMSRRRMAVAAASLRPTTWVERAHVLEERIRVAIGDEAGPVGGVRRPVLRAPRCSRSA